MRPASDIPSTIDEYIARQHPDVQARLSALRETIRQNAPGAEERISYRMPAFHLGGNLVYFAAFERHVGFYPGASGIAAFTREIAGYRSGKGSVQFPHSAPLPLDLVAAMVRRRVAEQANRRPAKRASRKHAND